MTVYAVVTTVGRFTVRRDFEDARYPYAVANSEGTILAAFGTRDEAIQEAVEREARCARLAARHRARSRAVRA